jgi:2-iminobutanoate/2-iminopropanoate deaminase
MTDRARGWTPLTAAPGVAPPAGAYSPGIRAGDLVFVSGQVPRDPRTGAIVGTDVPAQTRQVFANVRAVLESAGGSLDDVVAVTVYLADIKDWDAFNDAYRQIFRAPYPTRTTVGAHLHGFLVEASAVALIRPRE